MLFRSKVISRLPGRGRRRHYFPIAPGVEEMLRLTIGLGFALGLVKRFQAAGALARSLVSLIRSTRGAA